MLQTELNKILSLFDLFMIIDNKQYLMQEIKINDDDLQNIYSVNDLISFLSQENQVIMFLK